MFHDLALLKQTKSNMRAETTLSSADFGLHIDSHSGALWSIVDPKTDPGDEAPMNWISGPSNAPWQPDSSRWGLGFADIGPSSLHRAYWTLPDGPPSSRDGVSTVVYTQGPLQLQVKRSISDGEASFTETYTFKNNGGADLDLASREGNTALGIYTPFNDHYTDSVDALRARTHAHVWANGGSSAWVRMERMGASSHRNLGMVLTKGSLAGYSVESRNRVTSSNTRGVFVLHPVVPRLKPGEEAVVQWTFFWHDTWRDFLDKCASRSDQFIDFSISSYVLAPGETATIRLRGARVNKDTTVDGKAVQLGDDGEYRHTIQAADLPLGEHRVTVSTVFDSKTETSVIFLNNVQSYDDLISARTRFIADKQQVSRTGDPLNGAYVLYDNQMRGQVTFDTDRDRNSGRERIGMGVLIARWLKRHPSDELLRSSLIRYYEFVSTRLQDQETGYVLDGPGDRSKRLYNWAWVMQLHLTVAELRLDLPPTLTNKSPLERFVLTLDSYYAEGGRQFYPIGLPVLAGLRALQRFNDESLLQRALSLFTAHGEYIADTGLNWPSSEVNFEQSIVGPAATILLELYRWTNESRWLGAAEIQLRVLLGFNGQQPDHRLHDVAIRHWDGYWFGKDRMWGDTFPHYWSAITAVALHHYGVILSRKGDKEGETYRRRADGIIRANLALFTPEGAGSCAWIYPLSVDGRRGHYPDPYANDQDWALAFLLEIEDDDE